MKRTLVALAILLVFAAAPAAAAGPGDDWPKSEWRKSGKAHTVTRARPRRRHRVRRSTRRRHKSHRSHARRTSPITTGSIVHPKVSARDELGANGARECVSAVSVVGDQATSMDGARAQAEKAWQQQVRFRSGELYADPMNAGNIAFRCVESSIRNFANRATEVVGINSQLKRCSMTAVPCRAPSVVDNNNK